MENNTPKHFVLQLGSFISLYLSITFLLVLLFALINITWPDTAESYWQIESAAGNVRLGIAMLLVFFPTFIILTRIVNQTKRQSNTPVMPSFTKWLLYLSLLIGAGALLVDLVVVILAFLNGEMTVRFLLKAGALLLVVGAAFYYFLQDARGYWQARERASVIYGAVVGLVVLVSLVAGFMNIDTPAIVRELKLDEKQIQDLSTIQAQIVNYYTLNQTLPESLADLPNSGRLPQASPEREAYTYEVTETGFNLCAEFARASDPTQSMLATPSFDEVKEPIKGVYNWDYDAGWYCFERAITK